jgi:hypothetical protein
VRHRAAQSPASLDAAALAGQIRRPARTVRRWLALWLAAGVTGIERRRAAGRRGYQLVCSADLADRWARCELPVPRRAS